jgi:hypothetical protein
MRQTARWGMPPVVPVHHLLELRVENPGYRY